MSKQPRMPRTLQHINTNKYRATLYYLSITCAVINAITLMIASTSPAGLIPWMIGYFSLALIVSVWGIVIARNYEA